MKQAFFIILLLQSLFSKSQIDTFKVKYGDSVYMSLDENGLFDLKNNLKDGIYLVFENYKGYESLLIKGMFKNQKKEGNWIYWKRNQEVKYLPKKIRDSIFNEINNPNDTIVKLREVSLYDSVPYSHEIFYNEGFILKKNNYLDGKILTKTEYPKMAIKNTVWVIRTTYLPDGKYYKMEKDSDNIINHTGYYSNDTIEYEGKSDYEWNKFGTWKDYYPNGKIKKIGELAGRLESEKIGRWKFWNEEGKIDSVIMYEKK